MVASSLQLLRAVGCQAPEGANLVLRAKEGLGETEHTGHWMEEGMGTFTQTQMQGAGRL